MNVISTRETGSRRVQFHPNTTDIHTEQSMKNESDINSIMRKFRKTGALPDPVLNGVYGDFSTAEDYHTAQNKIIEAKHMFQALPSDIRTAFKNDPGLLLAFVNDPENRAAAQKMGLIPPDDPKPAEKADNAPSATDAEDGGNVGAADEPPSE